MISIADLPVQIIETGDEVKARIKIDPLNRETTCVEFETHKICNYDTCHIKIGSKTIPFVLINAEEGRLLKITLECKEDLSYLEWKLIIYNAFQGIAIKQIASEWSDIYNQKPIEKDYLTDDQKDRLHKLLIKEIDKYFRSGKARMSYTDVIKIEEIIINVLNGE